MNYQIESKHLVLDENGRTIIAFDNHPAAEAFLFLLKGLPIIAKMAVAEGAVTSDMSLAEVYAAVYRVLDRENPEFFYT
jgi:hypothetical protein